MNRLPCLWVALLLLFHACRGAEADPPLAVAPFDSDQAKAHQKAWADHLGTPVQITNPLGMKLNLIPPGEFVMGSPKSEPGRSFWQSGSSDDEAQHLVKITKPFYLSAHEVTQEQYERVMGKNPSLFKRDTKPVESVSWNDAVAFCGKLSEQEGVEYRLPTEAEWEYACRAGTTTAYSFGNDVAQLGEYAWHKGNSKRTTHEGYSKRTTHPVGELKPNAWGLYDMHGNVWEWCQDWHGDHRDYDRLQVVSDPTGPAAGKYRVLRGGAFVDRPLFVRAAVRTGDRPVDRFLNLGFRLARTITLTTLPLARRSRGSSLRQRAVLSPVLIRACHFATIDDGRFFDR